jgi:hypothetical protein
MNAYMSTSSQSARGWTLHDMLHACDELYHGQCAGMENNEYEEYAESDIPYICPFCKAN